MQEGTDHWGHRSVTNSGSLSWEGQAGLLLKATALSGHRGGLFCSGRHAHLCIRGQHGEWRGCRELNHTDAVQEKSPSWGPVSGQTKG